MNEARFIQPDRTRCTECNGEMEQGFIPDCSHASILQPKWFRGLPQKRWLGGLKINWNDGGTVETYRCKDCGYLKSYAKHVPGLEIES
jgi:hypothetical protein